jgi:ribosomal protein S18 acetylase RimI-like enzyme
MTAGPGGELAAVDHYCDAVPRSAATVEEFGTLRLFVPTEASFHPWYARPAAAEPVRLSDLAAVAARQRVLGQPVAIEWIKGRPEGLEQVCTDAGLRVRRHPLLVAATDELLPLEPQVDVRMVTEDLARVEAVADIGFAHAGTDIGPAGTEEIAGHLPKEATLAKRAARVAAGQPVLAAAYVDGFPVARGAVCVVGGVAEITGVTTLPAFRRQGLGAAVTAVLSDEAVRRGARLLWMSATDDVVARVYSRLGFREVGASCAAYE